MKTSAQRFVPPYSGEDLLGNGDGLVVTWLAGDRPKLLTETLRTFRPVLDRLPKARSVSYLNQTDRVSEALLQKTEMLRSEGPRTSIGQGYAALASAACEARWWLHLEDDWRCFEPPTVLSCLREAVSILEHHQDIVQVRLRYYKERVLQRHMVTNQPIRWVRRERFDVAHAHWTFNPALARGEIGKLFQIPLQGEEDAQRRVQQHTQQQVSQVFPGAFVHIGGEHSLRLIR